MKKTLVHAILVLAFLAPACGRGSEEGARTEEPAAAAESVPERIEAAAAIEARSDSQVSGMATFAQQGDEITLNIEIQGAPPGEHAMHIHAVGDCSAPDGTSAGGHWNPTEEDHGRWGAPPHHLGDVGNIQVGEDGSGSLSMTTDRWTIGTGEINDIVGKALILHAAGDDFTSQPTGAAGGRIGCGVIG